MGQNVIGTDIYDREWIANALNVNVFYQVPRVAEGKLYFDKICEICLKENISYVFPLTDPEIDLLSKEREWFRNHGILLCLSSSNAINICRNSCNS